MATNRPRIQVTLDDDTSEVLVQLASQNAQSISGLAADLICQALDINEDVYLSKISHERLVEDDGKRLSHDEAWA